VGGFHRSWMMHQSPKPSYRRARDVFSDYEGPKARGRPSSDHTSSFPVAGAAAEPSISYESLCHSGKRPLIIGLIVFYMSSGPLLTPTLTDTEKMGQEHKLSLLFEVWRLIFRFATNVAGRMDTSPFPPLSNKRRAYSRFHEKAMKLSARRVADPGV
jgi:hypothetical protein